MKLDRQALLNMRDAEFTRILQERRIPTGVVAPPMAPREQRVDSLLNWLRRK